MDAAVACEDVAVLIRENRNIEPKGFDAAGDLLDLPVAVQSRVARIELQALDRDALDVKLVYPIRSRRFAPHRAFPVARRRGVVL